MLGRQNGSRGPRECCRSRSRGGTSRGASVREGSGHGGSRRRRSRGVRETADSCKVPSFIPHNHCTGKACLSASVSHAKELTFP